MDKQHINKIHEATIIKYTEVHLDTLFMFEFDGSLICIGTSSLTNILFNDEFALREFVNKLINPVKFMDAIATRVKRELPSELKLKAAMSKLVGETKNV